MKERLDTSLWLPGLRQLPASLVHTQRHPSLHSISGEMTPRGVKQAPPVVAHLEDSVEAIAARASQAWVSSAGFSGSPQVGMPL